MHGSCKRSVKEGMARQYVENAPAGIAFFILRLNWPSMGMLLLFYLKNV